MFYYEFINIDAYIIFYEKLTKAYIAYQNMCICALQIFKLFYSFFKV